MFDDNGEDISRTLLIYTGDSCYKYFDIFSEHLYIVDECGDIIVYSRDMASGEESLIARFKKWDYFIIE